MSKGNFLALLTFSPFPSLQLQRGQKQLSRGEGFEKERGSWQHTYPLTAVAGVDWGWGSGEKGHPYWQRPCHVFSSSSSFFFLHGHTLSPLKLGGTIWLVLEKEMWLEVMCVLSRLRHRKDPVCICRLSLSLWHMEPRDQSGLDHRVTTWRTAAWESIPTSSVLWMSQK